MTRLFRILLTISLVLTFFVGCTTRKQTQDSTSPGAPAGTTDSDGDKSAGTVDSGGGNTFMGKPLESYIVKVRELPAFISHVQPIIETEALKDSDLKRVIDFVLDKKSWYLIPAELKQLPSEKIASAVGTDQAALQDLRQVWLNQKVYDDMKSPEAQGTLLVHEILMGLKLLKFDSALFECRARYFGRHTEQYCLSSYSKDLRGKPSDLTEIDYSQIRSATITIIEKGSKMSLADWNDLLYTEGFSTPVYEYVPKSSKKTMPLSQLADMIQKSKTAKSWPKLGYDFTKFITDHPELLTAGAELPDTTWKSDTTCDFDVEIKGDVFSVTLKEGAETKTYSSPWTAPVESVLLQDTVEKNYFYRINSPTLKLTGDTKTGDEVLYVTLKFANDFLMGAEFDKTICLNSDCSQSGNSVNGYKKLCSMKNALKLSSKKEKQN
ncbi:MAG: hypothetical protein JNL11_19510 [Bdellovibrionaceae bacterium]|nr:hypothetical protein [Pseudobdellovibrionaceae bacterium]